MTDQLAQLPVLVTRAADQVATLSEALRAEGAVPIEVPAIQIEVLQERGPLAAALAELGVRDWIAFTSANAVRATASLLGGPRALPARIAVVGGATAAAAAAQGWQVDLVAEAADAEGLGEALVTAGAGATTVCIPRAELSRPGLRQRLVAAGARLLELPVYRTVPPPGLHAQLAAALGLGPAAVVLASPSAARFLAAAAGENAGRLMALPAFCGGMTTAEEATARGYSVRATATVPGNAALIRLLIAHSGQLRQELPPRH